MRKGYSILFVVLLMTNYLLILSSFISRPVNALDYGIDADLGNVDASFWGEDADDRSGRSVASAGDVNGDGYDDILIGAYHDEDGGNRAGQTYLILGKAPGWAMDTDLSGSDASFWGEDSEDLSGCSVAGAGDVNGDGYDDILIGANGDNDGGSSAGQTYLILGNASGWTMDTDLSASDASFWGEGKSDMSGSSVTGAGDVNGDGYDDILIGAYGNEADGGDHTGQTYLILGKASGWAMDTHLFASDASFWGEDRDDYSGTSVAGAGDVNGDGYDDILIGAHGDDDGDSGAGQTYLILGKASGWAMDTDLSASDASFWGEDGGDHSGYSVAGAGDVNGDGFDDVLIGAPDDEDNGGNAGQTYLILGKASGWTMDTDLSTSDASFWGENGGDYSGTSVAGAGDVNGDGCDDILIGAYGNEEGGGNNAGQTYLILGKASGWAMDADLSASGSFWGENGGDYSGISVAGAGDVNGDGFDDVLIGAYGDDDGGIFSGQTYLIFPDHNSAPISITSVKAYSDTECTHEISLGEQGDKIYLELQGNDGDARKNIAQIWVKGSSNPSQRFRLRLHETGANTGKFRGNITIANRTHDRYRWINASEGGWVQITSRKNPTKFVNLTIGQGIDIDPNPTIVYTPEDIFYSQQFEATGILPDSWSFDTNSSWLTWNSTTREIYGTPDNSHIGSYWAKLKAESVDADGLINFTIQVNNTKPVITTSNVLGSNEGLEYVVDYNSSDDGQGRITWHLTTDAPWLHLNESSGMVCGTPQQSDVGNYTVNISVDDGNGGWDYTEFTLRVSDVNYPPVLENVKIIPNNVNRGRISTIYIQASDPESGTDILEPHVEARGPSSDWMEVNCSYNFEGDNFTAVYIPPATSGIGGHSFRIKLMDKGNVSGSWNYFNNSLNVKNSLPFILESFENISVYNDKNSLFDLLLYATDYEDIPSELSWEVIEYSPISLFDAYMKNDRVVEIWPASVERSGLGKIHLSVKDSDLGIFHKNITVEILNGTEKPNVVINLESPENSTIINTETVNLTWTNEGYAGVVLFDVYFGNSMDNMSLEFPDVQETSVELMELTDNTTYYWKVTAKIDGIPTVFISEIHHFSVQFDFVPDNRIELSFNLDKVDIKRGESVSISITLKNMGNMAEEVKLEVVGELKGYVSIDNIVKLAIGEERVLELKIFADSKFEVREYDLTIKAIYSEVELSASLKVNVMDGSSSGGESGMMESWLWFLIGVVLFFLIVGLLIFLIKRSKKKEDSEGEAIDAEIELHPRTGITQGELEMLAIGGTSGSQQFQGRLADMPLQYKLPDQTSPYQHKSLAQAPAPQVTLPQLKVTGDVKEPPKALPQTSVVPATGVVPTTPVPTPTLPVSTPASPTEPAEPPALPMVGSVPTAPITPSVTVAPATTHPAPPPVPASSPPAVTTPSPAPPVPPAEPPLPPPAPFSPEETGIKLSHDSVKNASVFRIDEPMPCSICYGEISSGLQASRCSCGNISHLSCGIKVGKCSECGNDYQGMLETVSQEAIVESIEDSQKTAKREVDMQVDWDEKGDMMKGLLKKLMNNEITVEQYQQISMDIRESF